MTIGPDLAAGARNLLLGCADLERGDDLLIVREDPSLGWYDEEAPDAVAEVARSLGMTVSLATAAPPGDPRDRGGTWNGPSRTTGAPCSSPGSATRNDSRRRFRDRRGS